MKNKLKNYDVNGVIEKLYNWAAEFDLMTAMFLMYCGYEDEVIAEYVGVPVKALGK